VHSGVAQRQSIRLLTGLAEVRVLPPELFRGQGLMESRLPWEQESPSSTLGTPTREWGLDVVGGMRVLQTRWMGSSPIVSTTLAAVAEWIRREFPKLVDAGSIPAGSTGRIAETD
jgi:hypothetical protein